MTAGGRRRYWYSSVWIMVLAGYVFPPLGLYLMWRYRTWPVPAKFALTVAGIFLAVVSSYVSSVYVMARVF